MKTNKPIKVAFDVSPLVINKTGVAFYIERMMTHFAEQHPDVEVIGFYWNFLGRRDTKHFPKAPNIRYRPITFIPSKIIYQLRRWNIEIPLELLVKEKIDFVLYANFLSYPSLYKVPSAPVIHDLTFVDIPEYVSAKNGSDLRRFVPVAIKRSKFVVTVSEFSKKRIMQHYDVPADRVLTTPIPPEAAIMLPEQERAKHIEKLGITKPFILFLSTIEPRKNLVSLIDAYAKLPATLRNAYTLVVVGRVGWNCDAEIAKLEQAPKDGLDVLRLGYVSDEDREALFQSTSLYINPSNYEGFGMPILEAMTYGRPCAISNIDVFKEVAGESARYFNQKDPKDIASTIESILADPKLQKTMSKASLDQLKQFSWTKVADALYDKIVQAIKR
jgi:glycosyltransferase involved in cell wall biosynthesis